MRKSLREGDEIVVLQVGATFTSEDEPQESVSCATFSSTVQPYLVHVAINSDSRATHILVKFDNLKYVLKPNMLAITETILSRHENSVLRLSQRKVWL